MRQTAMLTTASLLNILLMMFHLADDILFGMAPPGFANLFAVLVSRHLVVRNAGAR